MMIGAAHRGLLRCAALSYVLCGYLSRRMCASEYAGDYAGDYSGDYAGEPAVNLWSGVLAGYSTGGLAHPRHFGFFDRKQVA